MPGPYCLESVYRVMKTLNAFSAETLELRLTDLSAPRFAQTAGAPDSLDARERRLSRPRSRDEAVPLGSAALSAGNDGA